VNITTHAGWELPVSTERCLTCPDTTDCPLNKFIEALPQSNVDGETDLDALASQSGLKDRLAYDKADGTDAGHHVVYQCSMGVGVNSGSVDVQTTKLVKFRFPRIHKRA